MGDKPVRLSATGIAALIVGVVLGVSAPAEALQCVPFARELSGITIRGDAWTWWNSAAGQYERGSKPHLGAVVVFKRFAGMRHGHVAVVTKVLNPREVLVDHANWAPHRGRGRGEVSKMVVVTDVSPHNDWTRVRVWNPSTKELGIRIYPTYGFIYPSSLASFYQQASAAAGQGYQSAHGDFEAVDAALAVTEPHALTGNAAAHRGSATDGDHASGIQTVAAVASASQADGVWEGDQDAARAVGAGRY